MQFERGKDMKDALQIGRLARATQVCGYYLLGKIVYDDGGMSRNFGFTTTDKDGTKLLLKYFEQGKLVPLSFQRQLFFDKIKTKRAFKKYRSTALQQAGGKIFVTRIETLNDFNVETRIKIQQFNLQVKCEYNPLIGNVTGMSSHEVFGEDLAHEGELYVIPKERVL